MRRTQRLSPASRRLPATQIDRRPHIIREWTIMVALLNRPPGNMRIGSDISGEGAERRMFPRKEVSFRVEGRRLDHTIDARQMPHLSFSLKDLSLGGLAAMSTMPMARGEHVTVFFPPEGPARGWDAYGRVIRCDASPAGGYRVAVAFDPLPAA